MILMEGRKLAEKITAELRNKVANFSRPPGLAFILIGENPSSRTYVSMKKKKCLEIGISSIDHVLPEEAAESEVLFLIEKLNKDPFVDGILVQLPLPKHLSTPKIIEAVLPEKDIDGFHPLNMGRTLLGEENGFLSCTPFGIKKLLDHYAIAVSGKHVVILGRSNIVGKPLAAILMQKKPGCNATVTIAHSLSEHLSGMTKTADILIAAIGSAHFVKPHMVKKGAVVIDVGINKLGGKIVGDVDFESVRPLCSHITPVPGGVGPMTIATLLSNTVLAYERRL